MAYWCLRKQFGRDYLTRLLKITAGNVSQAAKPAQRNRIEFYKLLQRHELDPRPLQVAQTVVRFRRVKRRCPATEKFQSNQRTIWQHRGAVVHWRRFERLPAAGI